MATLILDLLPKPAARRRSDVMRRRWKCPEYRAAQIAHRRKRDMSVLRQAAQKPEIAKKIRDGMKRYWRNLDPVQRAQKVEAIRKVSTRTHCKQGHPFSGDNLYVTPLRGRKQCRTCNRKYLLKYRLARRNARKT